MARLPCGGLIARCARTTELTLAERNAVTKAIATRYARLDKAGKNRVFDELCATTVWHRNQGVDRKSLRR
jgi:hypothetical protein